MDDHLEIAARPRICALHHDRVAVATCDHCGTFACADCVVLDGDRQICRTCIDEGRVALDTNPWERRGSLGLPRALGQTIIEVTLRPAAFFRTLSGPGRVTEAVGFVALLLLPVSVVGAVYGQAFLAMFGDAVVGIFEGFAADLPAGVLDQIRTSMKPSAGGLGAAIAQNVLLGLPFWIVLCGLFAVLQHAILSVLGGPRGTLDTTMKTVLYANAIRAWEIVPLFNFVSLAWLMTANAVGLSAAHKTSGWRGFAATWGLAVFSGCCCTAGVFAIAFAVASLGAR